MTHASPPPRFRIMGFLKWGVSVAFLVVLFSAVSSTDIARLFKDPNWGMIAVSLGLTVTMIAVSCWKWLFVLRRSWPAARYGFLVRIYMIGYFFSNLLPSVVGGDVARITYVGRRSGDMAGSAVSVFVERFTGILVLLILAIAAPLLRPSLYRSLYIEGAALLAAILLLGLLLATACRVSDLAIARFLQSAWNGVWRQLDRAVARVWSSGVGRCDRLKTGIESRIEKFFSKLAGTIEWIRNDRAALLTVLLQTSAFYFITWCNVYVALRVFHVEVPFLGLCAVVPAIMLVAMIPISQASIGLAEGCYVVYLGLLGVSREEALAAALLLRAKFLLVGAIGFVVYHAEGSKVTRDGIQSEA